MANTSTVSGVSRQVTGSTIGVPGANSIPRIQFSTGTAKALRDFSFDMFNASSRIEDQLDAQALAEGEVEGATAGATGQFETRDYLTIRNRAYNQAGIQTFVATLETRSIARAAELRLQYANDPVGLQTAMTAYMNGVADQINEISPGAGAMYTQRQTTRMQPAIEAARDNASRLTRDQADAAIIGSQVALAAEVRLNSVNLFSDNPALSQASASAIAITQQEIMRIYNAIDPNTGQNVYSAGERATALTAFNENVMTSATLSWFEAQPNKLQAYLDFASGEFTVDLNVAAPNVTIIDANGGTRNLPVSQGVRDKLATAVAMVDPNLSIQITSGGQPTVAQSRDMAIEQLEEAGEPYTNADISRIASKLRTGSTRHDEGGAADVVLIRDGVVITPLDDPALYERFLEAAASAGFAGLGHYDWGVHVGGGSVTAWGPSTTGSDLDPAYAAAIARGRESTVDTVGGVTPIAINDTLSESAFNALDAEMRSQINFNNAQADRIEREEAADLVDQQNMTSFDLTNRLYSGGLEGADGGVIPELTRAAVTAAVENRAITPQVGKALIKALTVEAPNNSDRTTYDEILARLYTGEDVQQYIIENSGKLSRADAAALMARNDSRNVQGNPLTNSQQFQYDRLDDLLTPDGLMQQIDAGAEARKFAALDEFYMRVAIEGEAARDVAADLSERAVRDIQTVTRTELGKLVFPRFSVTDTAKPTQINVAASAEALKAAFDAKSISDASFRRQLELLRKWDAIQRGLE